MTAHLCLKQSKDAQLHKQKGKMQVLNFVYAYKLINYDNQDVSTVASHMSLWHHKSSQILEHAQWWIKCPFCKAKLFAEAESTSFLWDDSIVAPLIIALW